MGWSLGYDDNWQRDIGYGVPALCDHPSCKKEIDRGLAYVCGSQPYGGDLGCGLFFCDDHLNIGIERKGQLVSLCNKCEQYKQPYKKIKGDTEEWINHKLTHESWEKWRQENPEWVKKHSKEKV